jgi:hypothetical protein
MKAGDYVEEFGGDNIASGPVLMKAGDSLEGFGGEAIVIDPGLMKAGEYVEGFGVGMRGSSSSIQIVWQRRQGQTCWYRCAS